MKRYFVKLFFVFTDELAFFVSYSLHFCQLNIFAPWLFFLTKNIFYFNDYNYDFPLYLYRLTVLFLDLNFPNGTVVNPVDDGKGGCPWQYEWCHDTPQLPLAQFLVGATLVCIGFPVSCVLISILYSKIIGPFPQVCFGFTITSIFCHNFHLLISFHSYKAYFLSNVSFFGPLYFLLLSVKNGARKSRLIVSWNVSPGTILVLKFWNIFYRA